MSSPQTFVFIGRSGCGKGTQAKLLIEELKKNDPAHEVMYIETGARIREFIADNAGFTRDIVKEILSDVGVMKHKNSISANGRVLLSVDSNQIKINNNLLAIATTQC